MEDAQVETGVLHATGILCRSTHTDHTLDGEVQQHVVGLLLVERELEANHVVQEASLDTEFVVGHRSPLQGIVHIA